MSDKKIDLIAQLLAKAESTTPEEAGTGTELVLVNRAAKVDEHYAAMPKSASRDRGGKGSQAARGHGYTAGQQANTGGTAVGQRKRLG